MKRALMKSLVVASALALALTACGGDDDNASSSSSSPTASGGVDYASLSGDLKGSGASFPDAFYQAVIDKFADATGDRELRHHEPAVGDGRRRVGAGGQHHRTAIAPLTCEMARIRTERSRI